MKYSVLTFLTVSFCHSALTQNLKVLSELGVAIVESDSSKNIALYTNAGLGTETNLRVFLLDVMVSQSMYSYRSGNGGNSFYNIRSFDLNLSAKKFIRLSDRSFMYGLMGPRLTVNYQKRTENYVTGLRFKEHTSLWLLGYSVEAGLRTHVLGRTWFDIGITERRDLKYLNKDSNTYIKALRRALKIGFHFYLGKNSYNPSKKSSTPTLKIY
jgi:hypothetical protein